MVTLENVSSDRSYQPGFERGNTCKNTFVETTTFVDRFRMAPTECRL